MPVQRARATLVIRTERCCLTRTILPPWPRNAQVLIIGGGPAGLTLPEASPAPLTCSSSKAADSRQIVSLTPSTMATRSAWPTRWRRRARAAWAGRYLSGPDGSRRSTHTTSTRAAKRVPRRGRSAPRRSRAYLGGAARQLNLRDLEFDANALARDAGLTLPFDDGTIRPTAWRFGTPTRRIVREDREWITTARHVTVLTDAHAVDLRLSDGHDAVREVTVRTLHGREQRIRADIVVVACGGLETARLLLNATDQTPAGVANSSGLVGRCLHGQHPHIDVPPLRVVRPELFDASLETPA